MFFDKFVDVRRVFRDPAVIRDLDVGDEINGHLRAPFQGRSGCAAPGTGSLQNAVDRI
jgi:hypothetical protein